MYGDFGLDSNKHSSSEQLSILTQILICYITESAHTWHSWKLLALGLWSELRSSGNAVWRELTAAANTLTQGINLNFSESAPLLPTSNAHELKFNFIFIFTHVFNFFIVFCTLPFFSLPHHSPWQPPYCCPCPCAERQDQWWCFGKS